MSTLILETKSPVARIKINCFVLIMKPGTRQAFVLKSCKCDSAVVRVLETVAALNIC